MKTEKKASTVVVTGDFTLDWNLARGKGPEGLSQVWEAPVCSQLRWQRGGSGLLADLIEEISRRIEGQQTYKVLQQAIPRRAGGVAKSSISPEDERFHHSFASWKSFDFVARGSKVADAYKWHQPVWRVSEFEGVNRCLNEETPDWARVADDDSKAELVVLDDANLGFRENPALWPASLNAPGRHPWVIVKMSSPVANGALWNFLCEKHAGRLIAVMTVNDLRRTTTTLVSHALSWERTAQDLSWELKYNKALENMRNCAHVVISFNAVGAFLLSRGADKEPVSSLLFDPEFVEGMWDKSYPGKMVGYSSCLTAGIAREVMLAPDQPNILNGISAGLWALRTLHLEGYGQRGASAEKVVLEFPVRAIVSALEAEEAASEIKGPYKESLVPSQLSSGYWTILTDRCKGDLSQLATDVVLHGPKEILKAVPLGRFGNLLTVDRQEIESLRSISSLVGEYVAQDRPKRPLSIAVFGPPGSGKSFGITELAKSLLPGEIEIKEFNLSQIRSYDELLSAFHQVRDIGLNRRIPLVFWDEFDGDFEGMNYGWLRYFLAPMQDGVFKQGDLVHPIGRAIFVFAGGTSWTLEGFGGNRDERQLRAAKVPDFLSRLKGYLNVLGPNPLMGKDDPYYVLRRAILLRSMLERGTRDLLINGKLQIDDGVLRALLLTSTFKHGARSMESILSMSQLEGKTVFDRSCLPTRAQLGLHVDGQNFLALVHQLEFDDETVEKMARVAHEVNFDLQKRFEKKKGPGSKDAGQVGLSMLPYDALEEDKKEQNRNQVRDIPGKLAFAGCSIVQTREGDHTFIFPPDLVEALASREHTRWMRMKASEGFRYGQPSKEEPKLSLCMLPWERGKLDDYGGIVDHLGPEVLSEDEKEKDRAAVRGIARILNETGYTVVDAPRDVSPETRG